MSKRPATVDLASYLLWLLVGAGLVVCVLVVIFRDRLAETWAPEPMGDSTVQPVDFVPVILVLYIVIALTTLTLVPLLRLGHNWARHSLAAITLGIFLSALATVRTMPPTMVRGSAIAAGVIAAVTLVFLWHPDSRRFARESAAEELARDAGIDTNDGSASSSASSDGA
jgi:hypothetical protein